MKKKDAVGEVCCDLPYGMISPGWGRGQGPGSVRGLSTVRYDWPWTLDGGRGGGQ